MKTKAKADDIVLLYQEMKQFAHYKDLRDLVNRVEPKLMIM
jgi:hypothetical protein